MVIEIPMCTNKIDPQRQGANIGSKRGINLILFFPLYGNVNATIFVEQHQCDMQI